MLSLGQRNQLVINATPLWNGFDWGENPSYEYIAEMRRSSTPDLIRQYIEGYFVAEECTGKCKECRRNRYGKD